MEGNGHRPGAPDAAHPVGWQAAEHGLRRQIYLSIVAFGSVLWIVALISLAAPGCATSRAAGRRNTYPCW
jgi:hypothetical protein